MGVLTCWFCIWPWFSTDWRMSRNCGNSGRRFSIISATDMDLNLREMGVGDLSVPKHMQRVGEAFYGRAQAYRAGLARDGELALVEALERNIYGQAAANRAAAARLAAYIRETVGELRVQPASAASRRQAYNAGSRCYRSC